MYFTVQLGREHQHPQREMMRRERESVGLAWMDWIGFVYACVQWKRKRSLKWWWRFYSFYILSRSCCCRLLSPEILRQWFKVARILVVSSKIDRTHTTTYKTYIYPFLAHTSSYYFKTWLLVNYVYVWKFFSLYKILIFWFMIHKNILFL